MAKYFISYRKTPVSWVNNATGESRKLPTVGVCGVGTEEDGT